LSTYDSKIQTKQHILNDFVVSVIFQADACTTQYEFIVVNGQTTTSAFHKNSVATTLGGGGQNSRHLRRFFLMSSAKNY